MKHVFVLLFGVVLALAGCDTADNDAAVSAVGLDLGTTFTYHWTFTESDETGSVLRQQENDLDVRVAGRETRVGPYPNVLRLETRLVAEQTPVAEVWYRETDDYLLQVAYRNAGAVPPAAPKQDAGMTAVFSLSTAPGRPPSQVLDSLFIVTPPFQVYRFPLTDGQQWGSSETQSLQVREVIGIETVTVPAGTFRCAKIRTVLPSLASNQVWFDFVAEEGLILRTFEAVQQQRDAQGHPIGTFTSRQRFELIRKTTP